MRPRSLVISACLLLITMMAGAAETDPAIIAVGFGVGVPYELPVDWSESFSFLTVEALLSPNLTVAVDLGTYPPHFPDFFEGTASALAKAWIGPVNAFAGGGFTLQWRRVGSAWGFNPHLTLKGGFQIWMLESLAVVAQFRTHEPIPVQWAFDPEFSLGMTVALGSGRPEPLIYDPATLWLIIGLGVGALIAFLPRQ